MVVRGAAYLVAKAIRASRMVAVENLGMDVIREFEIADMPVTVAAGSRDQPVHTTGRAEWRVKSGKMPVAEIPAGRAQTMHRPRGRRRPMRRGRRQAPR